MTVFAYVVIYNIRLLYIVIFLPHKAIDIKRPLKENLWVVRLGVWVRAENGSNAPKKIFDEILL